MKLFKNIALFVLCATAALAQTASTTPVWSNVTTTNGVNLLRNGTGTLLELVLVDTSGTNRIVTLYDNSSSTSTNIVYASYTNYVQSVVSFTNVYTDSVGVSQTNIYNLLTNTPTLVASVTNEAPRIALMLLPANGTVTFHPTRGVGVSRGIQYLGGAAIGTMTTQGLP